MSKNFYAFIDNIYIEDMPLEDFESLFADINKIEFFSLDSAFEFMRKHDCSDVAYFRFDDNYCVIFYKEDLQ